MHANKSAVLIANTYKFNVYNICIFLFLFMSFHCTAYSVLGINTPISALLHISVVFLLIFNIRIKKNNINLLWVAFAGFILLWNQDFSNGNFIGFFSMILSIYIILILQNNNKWMECTKKIITFFSLEHIILGWFFLINTSFYTKFILPRFPAPVQGMIRKWISTNTLLGLSNHYSTSGLYCGIGVVVAFSYFMCNPKSKRAYLFLGISVLSLIFTQKRGPLIFAILAILIAYFAYKRVRFNTILKLTGIGLVLLIVGIFLYNYSDSFSNALSRFIVEDKADSDLTNGRMPLFNLAIDLFLQNPLCGVGWGGYRYEYTNYLWNGYSEMKTLNAHNIYLQLLSELGIIGASMIFFLMLYSFYKAIQVLYNNDKYYLSGVEKWMQFYSVSMQAFFLLTGITGNSIYYEQVLFPYALAIAATYYQLNKEKYLSYIHVPKKVRLSL